MTSIGTNVTDSLKFELLPAFATFILENKLQEYSNLQLTYSREVNMPLLQYFANLSEVEMTNMVLESSTEYLNFLASNNMEEQIQSSLQKWRLDQLPGIEKFQVVTEDITLVGYVRKKTLLHLLPAYTNDIKLALDIVQEIDRLKLEQDSASFKTFVDLLAGKITEHAHFIEQINNTSPGIIYLFDVIEGKDIYSNNKVADILGYTPEEIQAFDNALIKQVIHPLDQELFDAHIKSFDELSDSDFATFQYRARDKQGNYKWMRNYSSIFKKTTKGKPWQIIGIAIDVDNEKRTADQLTIREEQLLEAQELTDMGSYEYNITTKQSQMTPQMYKILDLDISSKQEDFYKHVHPDDLQYVHDTITQAIENKKQFDYECRYLISGKEKIIWSKGTIATKDGQPIVRGTIMDITDRHRMINLLKESEAFYKQAQEISHIGNWKLNVKTNTITWSDEMYRIYGLEPSKDPLDFEKIYEFTLPEDRNYVDEVVGNPGNYNQPAHNFFYRIKLRNGQVKHIHSIGNIEFDANGNPTNLSGTAQDVTTQKEIEKQLLDNQNFIKKIADATPSIIASYNLFTGQYSYISGGIQKLLGYNPEQVMQEGIAFFSAIIHPDDLPLVNAQNNQGIEQANEQVINDDGFVLEFIYRLKHSNGTYRWFHTYGTIFHRNHAGKVEQILNISIDITDKMDAEKKLLEQEHFIRHIAEASPTILYLFDLEEQKFIYINKEVSSVLGYQPEEIIGLGNQVYVFLHPSDVIKDPDNYVKYKHTENTALLHQFEGRIKDKQGNFKWMLTREIVFKRSQSGKATQVIGSALDITDRKKMEQALIQKTLQLQQSNSSLEEFAHIASHDLQEPLRKISTFGDRLLATNQQQLTSEGQVYLDKIVKSAQRMQQLINDILSISMISGNKTFEPCSLNIILSEVLQTLEYKIEKGKAIIKADDLPTVKIVPAQFRQLFQNLLSNSLKFVDASVQPVITIKHEYLSAAKAAKYDLKDGRFLQISFIDNGIGFDEVYAEKIFAIFQRLHGKSEYEGTGIGLAICKKIVEHHGGVILAKPNAGKGSTFIIIIPA